MAGEDRIKIKEPDKSYEYGDKLYKCGPLGEAIEVPKDSSNGPEKLVKRLAWGGQPFDVVAHEIGEHLVHHSLTALLDKLNIYLGDIKAYSVEDGCGALVLEIYGRHLGNDGELSICSGRLIIELSTTDNKHLPRE